MIRRLLQGIGSVFDDVVGHPVNLVLAFFVSPLPNRYWGKAHGVGIFLSCAVQIGVCVMGFMSSYHKYAERNSQAIADSAIEVAKSQEATKVEAMPAMVFGAFTPLAFLSVSSTGRWLAYGVVSGVIRVVGYASDHPCGDPVLTLVDGFVWAIGSSFKATAVHVVSRASSFWNR
jgi:hypothetical protein